MNAKALNLKIPRLGKNRHGVFYVRSSALDATGRRKVTQHSLGTKNPHIAKILALKFCLTLAAGDSMSDFRDFIAPYGVGPNGITANGEDDHRRAMEAYKLILEGQIRLAQAQAQAQAQQAAASPIPVSLLPSAKHIAPGKLLRDAFDAHLEEETRRLDCNQTVNEKRVLFNEFIECFGNVPLNDITKTEITQRWRRVEFARPNKKIKGAKLSGARLEKRRGFLSKFFEWAYLGGMYHFDNPAKQVMATKAEIRSSQQPYAEFTADDLVKLFSPSFPKAMDKPDWYWLPLMSLFSGARLSELADLQLKDFNEIEGTKVFEIMKGKNAPSKRIVPIHHRLLELGLWEYVEALKLRGEEFLLPHRPAKDKENQTGREKSAGRQWGVWVSKCGITDKRKVFHSFRSTAITDLHNAGAGHASIRAGVGHAAVGVSGAHGGYVRGVQLQKLKSTIELLEFPLIEFLKLRRDDPTFAAFFANEAAKANAPKTMAKAESLRKHEAARLARETRTATSRPKKPA